uniref:Phlebovirus glycoprotein G2 fusion domain-containing protein n=1 Tax=Parastrongyloides trichosuri TaxID=131310 RepID=A0A0N4ZJ45_PARTI
MEHKNESLLVDIQKKILTVSNPIKCYSYVNGFTSVKNKSETKVQCQANDNCVRYIIIVRKVAATYKGCSSEFFKVIMPNIEHGTDNRVPNYCSTFDSIDDYGIIIHEEVCGCNNKDYYHNYYYFYENIAYNFIRIPINNWHGSFLSITSISCGSVFSFWYKSIFT